MKRMLLLLLCVISVSAVCQTGYDSSFRFYYWDQKYDMFQQNKTNNQDAIWLGDSITDGGEWAEFFPKKKVLNRGISADNTFGLLYRLHEVTKRKPKKLFILIGINDISRNIPDSVIIANYTKLIQRIKTESPKTKIYIQSIMPTNNEFTQFKNHQNKTEHILTINAALQNISNTFSATFIDLYNPFLDETKKLKKEYTNDGLHLTGAGYMAWVSILKNYL